MEIIFAKVYNLFYCVSAFHEECAKLCGCTNVSNVSGSYSCVCNSCAVVASANVNKQFESLTNVQNNSIMLSAQQIKDIVLAVQSALMLSVKACIAEVLPSDVNKAIEKASNEIFDKKLAPTLMGSLPRRLHREL